MPEIGEEVDYTTKRLRKGYIIACPKCGRKGKPFTVSTKVGQLLYVTHRQRFTGLSWTGIDFCMNRLPAENGVPST